MSPVPCVRITCLFTVYACAAFNINININHRFHHFRIGALSESVAVLHVIYQFLEYDRQHGLRSCKFHIIRRDLGKF
jgi:hypothetical protein